MRELSGGQKCVVALTIIFAIQRCDPAPFYLFDEVDANLDPMYRGAVADMISKQKQDKSASGDGCQFLTSSFHEELVKAADVHWLVSHSGMSRITKGTVDDQLKIVRKNQQQPQGMGAASRR
jgi:structural maintenance of chromosome 3 (chondroitin sulfate proteoglycan 6)